MTFNCPQCRRDHVEPLDAAYVLAVICADCADLAAYELVIVRRATMPDAA